jgi:hypothetical protein
MIFTYNFANWQKIPGIIFPISIARYAPKGWVGASYPKLYPTEELLFLYKRGKLTDQEYTNTYKTDVLNLLEQTEVITDLCKIVGRQKKSGIKYSGCVLLCYEKSSSFCHRHLVREWFAKQGFYSSEFSNLPQSRNIKPLNFRSKA